MTLKDRASWVPLLVRWPRAIAAAQVSDDLVDFTDFFPTLADLAQVPLNKSLALDGRSFAPRLLGHAGPSRDFVHVQLVKHFFIRDQRWKLLDNGELYDITHSPFVETKITVPTAESESARRRLATIAHRLHPTL